MERFPFGNYNQDFWTTRRTTTRTPARATARIATEASEVRNNIAQGEHDYLFMLRYLSFHLRT